MVGGAPRGRCAGCCCCCCEAGGLPSPPAAAPSYWSSSPTSPAEPSPPPRAPPSSLRSGYAPLGKRKPPTGARAPRTAPRTRTPSHGCPCGPRWRRRAGTRGPLASVRHWVASASLAPHSGRRARRECIPAGLVFVIYHVVRAAQAKTRASPSAAMHELPGQRRKRATSPAATPPRARRLPPRRPSARQQSTPRT